MKLTRKSSIVALLILTVSLSMFAGCERQTSTDYATTVVAKYGSEKIYLDEADFYAKLSQYQYEEQYAMAAYWKTEITTGYTYEDSVKNDTLSKILQTRILCDQAETYGVTLSEDDTAKITAAVAEFQASDAGVAIGASEELVTAVYTQNALANKVHAAMIADTDQEIDEAEYVCRDMDCIVVYPSKTEDGEEDTVDEEAAAAEIEQYLVDGEKVDDIYAKYDTDVYSMYKFSDYAVCKTNEYPFVEELFALENVGDVDTVYDENTGNYYVFRLTSLTDEEATQKAIASEIEDREEENFKTKYEALKEKAKSFKVDEDVWALVVFDEPIYAAPETESETSSEPESATEAE